MAIPEEFETLERRSPLTTPWEPIYCQTLADRLKLGIIVDTQHTNSRGLVHGGLIAALSDNVMGWSCSMQYETPRSFTLNLSLDYMGIAKQGQWLEFSPTVSKLGGTVCFAQCFVTANTTAIARASGVYKS